MSEAPISEPTPSVIHLAPEVDEDALLEAQLAELAARAFCARASGE